MDQESLWKTKAIFFIPKVNNKSGNLRPPGSRTFFSWRNGHFKKSVGWISSLHPISIKACSWCIEMMWQGDAKAELLSVELFHSLLLCYFAQSVIIDFKFMSQDSSRPWIRVNLLFLRNPFSFLNWISIFTSVWDLRHYWRGWRNLRTKFWKLFLFDGRKIKLKLDSERQGQ